MSDSVDSAMKTVCVGRFLIDLPQDIEVSFGQLHLAGWRIWSVEHQSEERYAKGLLDREAELSAQTNEKGGNSLETTIAFSYPDAAGRIFVFNREWNYYFKNGARVDINSVTIEATVRLHGVTLKFEAESAQTADAHALKVLAAQLRYRGHDEIPNEPGFCMDNAFLRDPISTTFTESTVMFAGYRKRPDLAIVLSTSAHSTIYKTLLERNAENEITKAYPAHFKVIKEGSRDINGIHGEEVSYSVREKNGTRAYNYVWESFTTKGDAMRPNLVLELGTGHGGDGSPVQSSLNDREVQMLWDRISSSVRPRPVVRESAGQEQPEQPAGRASAGTTCPAAGWWSCADHADGHQILGGTTQYFGQGVRMPQARLLGPVSIVDKLSGRQPTFELATPTVWTLARSRE